MIDKRYLESIGVFQDADGSYKRYRLRTANVEYDPGDPRAQATGNVLGYDLEEIPFPVVLPLATDPASIEEARAKAAASNSDFYHPRWGWLRWGVKREQEHAENLGAGAVQYTRRRVAVKPGPVDQVAERKPVPAPRKDEAS